MRQSAPPKLWLLSVCVAPGAIVLLAGLIHPRPAHPHQHKWAPCSPPGGMLRLLDPRSRAVSHLRPAEVVRLDCLPSANVDRCLSPESGCCFGPSGLVIESEGVRLVDFSDGGAGGAFGVLGRAGHFRALPRGERCHATHYQASSTRRGRFAFTVRFDDRGRTRAPDDQWIATYDDPPAASAPVWVTVGTSRQKEDRSLVAK